MPVVSIRAKYLVVTGPKKNKARSTRITVKEVLMDRTYDCSKLNPTISAKFILADFLNFPGCGQKKLSCRKRKNKKNQTTAKINFAEIVGLSLEQSYVRSI